MNDAFYTKQIKCPICNTIFLALKIKSRACIVLKKDEDFCTYYKELNPLFYEIFVCPACGYAASENSFNDLKSTEIVMLKDVFSGRKITRDFCKERNINDALDSYKLALYTANSRDAKKSIIAGLCLKIAWMYRYMKDEKEKVFIQYALDNYLAAYEKEAFPIGKMNQITLTYLIGELSRRLNNYEDAVTWFSKAVSSPERVGSPGIERLAREQWMVLREEIKAKTAL